MAFSICFLLPPKPKKEGQSHSFSRLLRFGSDESLLNPAEPDDSTLMTSPVSNGYLGHDEPMLRFTGNSTEPRGRHYHGRDNHLIIRDDEDDRLLQEDGQI